MIGKVVGKMNTSLVSNAAKRIFQTSPKGGEALEKACIEFFKEGIKNPSVANHIFTEQSLNATKACWDKNVFTRIGKWFERNTVSYFNFNKIVTSKNVSEYAQKMEQVYKELYPKTGAIREVKLEEMINNLSFEKQTGASSLKDKVLTFIKGVKNKPEITSNPFGLQQKAG